MSDTIICSLKSTKYYLMTDISTVISDFSYVSRYVLCNIVNATWLRLFYRFSTKLNRFNYVSFL